MNCSPGSPQKFMESVLTLRPKVAAFDCDGTLWSGDVGEGFFSWEIAEQIVPSEIGRLMRERYTDYKAGGVPEEQMCGEMVTMHKGMREELVVAAAKHYFENVFPGKIFAEMRELIVRLRAAGCDVWAVSSSNDWLIRVAMKHVEIPDNRILAAAVRIENGIVTDQLIQVPSGPGKPKAIASVTEATLDAAFGNSRWDTEMLAMAKHAFAINPNPDLEGTARERRWNVYFPDGTASRHL